MSSHRFDPTRYYNTIGTFPAELTVADGDTVVTGTIDAAGVDRNGRQIAGSPNPMNGPIYVEGAEPGDALRVEILQMVPTRATGWTRAALAANVVDPETARDLPPRDLCTWLIDGEARTVRLAEPPEVLRDLAVPLAPMIGCFGVAPALGEAISTATSGPHGGNMDYRLFGPATTVWFPVAVPGALFFLGDCHAVQGDGEIVGTGVETTFEVTVRLTVEKSRQISWPRGETADDIFTIGNARPLDQALQHATTEMLDWLRMDFGMDSVAAAHLLGQVVRYDVANVYDPAYTMACKIDKRWLPAGPGRQKVE